MLFFPNKVFRKFTIVGTSTCLTIPMHNAVMVIYMCNLQVLALTYFLSIIFIFMQQLSLTQGSSTFNAVVNQISQPSVLNTVSESLPSQKTRLSLNDVFSLWGELNSAQKSGSLQEIQEVCKKGQLFLESEKQSKVRYDYENYFRNKNGMIAFMKIIKEAIFRRIWNTQYE